MTTSIIDTINAVLKKHDVNDHITAEHITVTDSLVCEFAKPESYLSERLIEKLWPRIHRRKVFHFTTQEAAESIIASNTFRLGNLAKRYGEGEVSTFSKAHKLEGYLQLDSEGRPVYRALLMPNTFYASFTDASLSDRDQEPLWRRFSGGEGVRLTFDIEASNPNFRDIRYQAKAGVPIPVLTELSSELMRLHKKHFILSGISRVCAFYLAQADYGAEKECRILYKTWEGVGPQPIGSDSSAYVELPLGTMSEAGYKLDLVDVCSRDKPAMPDELKFTPRK